MCDSQLVTSSHFLVRSLDRSNYWFTSPSEFSINLSKPLKGSKAQISFAQIPNTYYNITNNNNSFKADLGATANTLYSLAPGNYTLSDLMIALQTLLTPIGTPSFTFNSVQELMTIANSANFTLNFNVANSIAKKIGFNPMLSYTGAMSYTGFQVPKLFDSSIYISCNFCTHIQTTSPIQNVSFVIPHNVNRGEIIQFYSSTQFALQPHVKDQTIGSMEFTVFDEDGKLLQNLSEWSIMLHII